jgi:hypothetical protein
VSYRTVHRVIPYWHQGLPGDGRDHAGARKRSQNNPWGVVNSARKHIAPICLQIPSSVKVTLGKPFLALKYLVYARQDSPCGTTQARWSDLAPVKYPTGVTGTGSSRKYFSWHALWHYPRIVLSRIISRFHSRGSCSDRILIFPGLYHDFSLAVLYETYSTICGRHDTILGVWSVPIRIMTLRSDTYLWNWLYFIRALDNFSTEEYVTSSVLGQCVFDLPSLTLVIGANIF